uniref:NADH-ubiquinone oxidoreductase chain 6 n=1 Tax=Hydrosaurus amboinensis TaxID=588074 RepID=D6RS46_9SAUR|nr:NADH dehydrogenase subunit 6 [Hydrosaurus amboinensis]BAJ08136.1 NADH dehydrogenase subunit 6 [Hydrosaurus amboinensis]
MYFVFLFSMMFLFLVGGVASNPSPCFGTGALVVASGIGCAVLAELGELYVALVLFLVYLGGMLVVFAYSVSLSSDLYPQAWDNPVISLYMMYYVLFVTVVGWCLGLGIKSSHFLLFSNLSVFDVSVFDGGYGGICFLYSVAGVILFLVGFSLLLTLLVVLELVRNVSFGSMGD